MKCYLGDGSSRIVKIAVSFGIAWALTIVVGAFLRNGLFGAHLQESERDIFFAWLGELFFFSVVGLAISIISLEKPENPSEKEFSDRLKILFGTTIIPPAVLRLSAEKVLKMACYAPVAIREVEIREFRKSLDAYQVEVCTEYQLKNILHDLSCPEELLIFVKPDDLGTANPEPSSAVLSIEIDGKEKLRDGPAQISSEGFKTPLQITIPANGSAKLKFKYRIWMKAGEEQSVFPQRVVGNYTLRITSRWSANPRIKTGDSEDQTLLFAQPLELTKVDALPGEKLFPFILKAPIEEKEANKSNKDVPAAAG